MRTLKTIFIGVIVSVFLAGQACSAPKGNNRKANNSISNNKQPNVIKMVNPRSNKGQVQRTNKSSQNRGKSSLHKRKARRSSETSRKREERNRSLDHNSALNNAALDRVRSRNSRAEELISSLERARWSQNPHDKRGQGNKGKPNMKDPFGHDKDSDREKWERGRPDLKKSKKGDSSDEATQSTEDVPAEEELPVLTEEELAIVGEFASLDLQRDASFEFQIEDSLVIIYQKIIDYYSSLIESGVLLQEQVSYYQDRISSYTRAITLQQSKNYITVGLVGDNTIGYSLDLTTEEHFGDSTFLIETTLVLQMDFISYEYTWDSRTGTWNIEGTQYYAGDEIVIQTEEVTITGEDATYEFSYDPDVDLIDGYTGGYFDMITTITDTQTETKVTQTSDKSLYIYRDPYGNVQDSVTGQAIIGAKITIHNSDGSIVTLDKASNPNAYNPQVTDATGRFAFNLRTDRKYYMVVSAPGYEQYRSTVFTEKWHVIREDIKLTPTMEQVVYHQE